MACLGKAPGPPAQSTWPGNGLEVILGRWPGRGTLAGRIEAQTGSAPCRTILTNTSGIPYKQFVAGTYSRVFWQLAFLAAGRKRYCQPVKTNGCAIAAVVHSICSQTKCRPGSETWPGLIRETNPCFDAVRYPPIHGSNRRSTESFMVQVAFRIARALLMLLSAAVSVALVIYLQTPI
jgi:hypothetical protein